MHNDLVSTLEGTGIFGGICQVRYLDTCRFSEWSTDGKTRSGSGESEAATMAFRKRLRNNQESKDSTVITSDRCSLICK
jgi:hypothetical protein